MRDLPRSGTINLTNKFDISTQNPIQQNPNKNQELRGGLKCLMSFVPHIHYLRFQSPNSLTLCFDSENGDKGYEARWGMKDMRHFSPPLELKPKTTWTYFSTWSNGDNNQNHSLHVRHQCSFKWFFTMLILASYWLVIRIHTRKCQENKNKYINRQ